MYTHCTLALQMPNPLRPPASWGGERTLVELRAHDAVRQRVLPVQPPPVVLGQVEITEHLLQPITAPTHPRSARERLLLAGATGGEALGIALGARDGGTLVESDLQGGNLGRQRHLDGWVGGPVALREHVHVHLDAPQLL